METKLVRNFLSRGINQLGSHCGGPNVPGPYAIGTSAAYQISNYYIFFLIKRMLWYTDTVNGQNILHVLNHVEMELGFEQGNAWGMSAWAQLLRQSLAKKVPVQVSGFSATLCS